MKVLNLGKKKTGYKSTGNMAVDMVAACIDFYHSKGKKLAYIRLEKHRWIMFVAFVREKIPGYDFSDGEVDFDGVKITQGSSLQVTALYAEFMPELIN